MKKNKLFFRIFFTFFMTALVLILSVSALFKSFGPERKLPVYLEKHLLKHFIQLTKELGENPSEQSIDRFNAEYGLLLRHENFKSKADSMGLPNFESGIKQDVHFSDEMYMGKYGNYYFLSIKKQQPKIMWFFEHQRLPKGWRIPFLTVIFGIIFIIVLSFLTIHWILKPLRVLILGVQQFSEGNLSYRIPLSHKSDFFDLANTFNQMAVKIENMIRAKEILLRDVSHELRSPLTRMNVAIDLISDEQMKKIMKEDIQKMEDMIHNLLESYQLKHSEMILKKSSIDVVEMLKRINQGYQKQKIKFLLNVPENLFLQIDTLQVERVFQNLIENSLKYAANQNLEVSININDLPEHVEIIFSDNGIGIEANHLENIFEPFYRVSSARTPDGNGFGLGLSIVKSIVEAHGGRIAVTSQLYHGTRFKFTLAK